MISEREKLIGSRLRAFREHLQIPRSKFAVSIGFGSERIASYESGRAALKYSVFKAVFQRYKISPSWLATGQGIAEDLGGTDDTVFAFEKEITRNSIFTEVYDKFLAAHYHELHNEASRRATESMRNLNQLLDLIQEHRESISGEDIKTLKSSLQSVVDRISALENIQKDVERRLRRKPRKI